MIWRSGQDSVFVSEDSSLWVLCVCEVTKTSAHYLYTMRKSRFVILDFTFILLGLITSACTISFPIIYIPWYKILPIFPSLHYNYSKIPVLNHTLKLSMPTIKTLKIKLMLNKDKQKYVVWFKKNNWKILLLLDITLVTITRKEENNWIERKKKNPKALLDLNMQKTVKIKIWE